MKRIAIATALVATLILAGGFLWRRGNMQEMNIKLNVKDLREHGLRLVSFADPSFDEKASEFLKHQPAGIAKVIKPLSVILENRGRHALVSTRLNWEITKANGKIINMPVGGVDPSAIIHGGRFARAPEYSGAVIPGNSSRFISLIGTAAEGRQVEPRSWQPDFVGSQTEMSEFNRAFQMGDEEEIFKKSSLFKHLTEATTITVSIDGAFFEDGSFVGENKTNFFELAKASIDAQYDLAAEISKALKLGKGAAEVVELIRNDLKASLSADSIIGPQSAGAKPADDKQLTQLLPLSKKPVGSYEFFRDMYSQRFLRLQEAVGGTEAISRTVQLLERPRKELRRL